MKRTLLRTMWVGIPVCLAISSCATVKSLTQKDCGEEAAVLAARGDLAQSIRQYKLATEQSTDPAKIAAYQGEIRRLKREGCRKVLSLDSPESAERNPVGAFEAASQACWFECPADVAKLCESRRIAARDALVQEIAEALDAKQYETAAKRLEQAYSVSPSPDLLSSLADARYRIKRKEALERFNKTYSSLKTAVSDASAAVGKVKGFLEEMLARLRSEVGAAKAEADQLKKQAKSGDEKKDEKARARFDEFSARADELRRQIDEVGGYLKQADALKKSADVAYNKAQGRLLALVKLPGDAEIDPARRKQLQELQDSLAKDLLALEDELGDKVRAIAAGIRATAERWVASTASKVTKNEFLEFFASFAASKASGSVADLTLAPLTEGILQPLRNARQSANAYLDLLVPEKPQEALGLGTVDVKRTECAEFLPEVRDPASGAPTVPAVTGGVDSGAAPPSAPAALPGKETAAPMAAPPPAAHEKPSGSQ